MEEVTATVLARTRPTGVATAEPTNAALDMRSGSNRAASPAVRSTAGTDDDASVVDEADGWSDIGCAAGRASTGTPGRLPRCASRSLKVAMAAALPTDFENWRRGVNPPCTAGCAGLFAAAAAAAAAPSLLCNSVGVRARSCFLISLGRTYQTRGSSSSDGRLASASTRAHSDQPRGSNHWH